MEQCHYENWINGSFRGESALLESRDLRKMVCFYDEITTFMMTLF